MRDRALRPGGDDVDTPVLRPGDTPARRLLASEYRKTIEAAITGVDVAALELPSDGSDGILAANATDALGDYQPYVLAAERVAAGAAAANALPACDDPARAHACIEQGFAPILRTAFRRPPVAEDFTRLTTLWDAVVQDGAPPSEAAELLAARVFLSPSFLFHREVGIEPLTLRDAIELDPYELAARLSYLLTGGPPDGELQQAADDGSIRSADVLRRHAARLFVDHGEDAVWELARAWLELDRLDTLVHAAVDEPLRAALREEVRLVVLASLHAESGRFDELFTSRRTTASPRLATHYGASAVANGDRYEWPAELERAGILSRAGMLAALGDEPARAVIHRGYVVRTRLFCDALGMPDADAIAQPVTDRVADSRCASCHYLMDPIGRGLSRYDELGRDVGTGEPGMLTDTDVDGAFSSVGELQTRLAESEEVRRCYANVWMRRALGRAPTDADGPIVDQLVHALDARGSTLDLVLALVASEPFRTLRGQPVRCEEDR